MWVIWGSVTGEKDLGVVVDQCPRCGVVAPCRVTGRTHGMHIYFVALETSATADTCTCHHCGGMFRCESWRYKQIIPFSEAVSLTAEELLERTNPTLKDRLAWARRLEEFSADRRFESAHQSLEQLRQGDLRQRSMDELLRWGELNDSQREDLVQRAEESARALQFARSVAARVPSRAGCLIASLTCLAIWSTFLWAPASRGNLMGGIGVVLAGLMAGAWVHQLFLCRRVRRWTHEVLIPEGRKSGINFTQFAAILEDLPPPSPRSSDEFSQLQAHAETIIKELSASGMKGSKKSTWGTDPDAF